MSIDNESDVTANLQIGPTTLGMVRIFVEAGGLEIPMDFEPEEAEEIAEEIRAAAARARASAMKGQKPRNS
jgi:ArsR family metal-binding transcriptional regulator